MKIGLELEYWVIDEKGNLDSAEKISEKLDFAEQEFVDPLLEIKTNPHEEVESLEEEINCKVSKVIKASKNEGLEICPLGTPLNSGHIEKVSSRRGEIQQEIVGENLEAAKRVAGTHIHFEKENVKNQLNTLTALDPALALLNSSPYYQGGNLGSSSRNQAYRYLCYKEFPHHGQLWGYIDSVDEWEERIEKRFKEFKQAGKGNGITEEEIERHFSAEDALWTPVRLRYDFPTVEWRAPDTSKPEKVLKLLKSVKKIVEKSSEEEIDTPSFEELEHLSRKAIEEGLQSREVREYLSDLGFTPSKYEDYSEKWKKNEEISSAEACKIRLEAAKEFRNSFQD